MKAAKILLNIASVFCFIYFALYIFTLVFIPLGVYCFLAGKRFAYKAENLDDIIYVPNKVFKGYVIYASIFCFPFGLLSIIPYVLLTSNRVKVSDYKYTYTRSDVSAIETERVPETAEPTAESSAEAGQAKDGTGAETASATAAEQTKVHSSAETAGQAKTGAATEQTTAGAAAEQTAEPKEETEEEKLEKFKKLENFKEKGLITEDELEQAREQLFGKKK